MFEFRTYQESGIDFLARPLPSGKPHKALTDAPGVGKTAQACGAAKKVKAKTLLIICPDPIVVKGAWRRTLVDTGAFDRDDIYIVPDTGADVPTKPVIIVGYAQLNYANIFRQIYWGKYDAVIVDEAHRLKNPKAKRTKKILGGGSESLISRGYWKWFLSGTIMVNRPAELYPLVSTMCPELLGKYREFPAYIKQYCNAYQNDRGGWVYDGASNIEELREALRPFMLRRELQDVADELPDVVSNFVYVDLGDLPGDDTNTPLATLRKEIGIAKIPYMVEYLGWRLAENPVEKILVFTYTKEVSEQLAAQLPNTRLIYGGATAKQKEKAAQDFINDPNVLILVAQLNSAGEAADGWQRVCYNIVNVEPDWSDGGYDQQIGRLWRVGQTQTVNVVTLIAENTLDEKVLGSRQNKRKTTREFYKQEGKQMLEEKIDRLISLTERQIILQERMCHLLQGGNAATVVENATIQVPAEEKETKPATGKKGAAAAKKADAAPVKEEKKAESAASSTQPELTPDDVRKAAAEVIAAKKDSKELREAIKKVVIESGAADGNANNIPPENREAAIEKLLAMLDEPESADPLASLGI